MDDFEEILKRIRSNDATLTRLNLGGKDINDQGARDIATALETNTTLTRLNLGYNQIGPAGAKALAEALKINTTLTKLNLGCNQIGNDEAKALAEWLKINNTLTKLYLFNNSIGPAGAQALATALETNTALTKLNLSRNQIDDRVNGDLKNINNFIGRNKAIHTISDSLFKEFFGEKNTPFPAIKDIELVCENPKNCQRIVKKLLSKKLEAHPEADKTKVDKTEIEKNLVDDMKKSRLGTLILIFCKDQNNKYELTMNDYYRLTRVRKNLLEANPSNDSESIFNSIASNPNLSGIILNKLEFSDVKHLIQLQPPPQTSFEPATSRTNHGSGTNPPGTNIHR